MHNKLSNFQHVEWKQSFSCHRFSPSTNYSDDPETQQSLHSFLPLLIPCPASIQRGRGLHDKYAPGLLMDSSAVICISKATCCRSERGYPARIPGIPIPNGKPIFRVLAGSFLMRFRSGPGFSESTRRKRKVNHCVVWFVTLFNQSSIYEKQHLNMLSMY